jgi:hypothetical protein
VTKGLPHAIPHVEDHGGKAVYGAVEQDQRNFDRELQKEGVRDAG